MEARPELRLYFPIWNRLKTDYQVSVTAPRALHKRIIKAIVNMKYYDLGYKLFLEPKRATLSHSSKGAILTFYLQIHNDTLDFRRKTVEL